MGTLVSHTRVASCGHPAPRRPSCCHPCLHPITPIALQSSIQQFGGTCSHHPLLSAINLRERGVACCCTAAGVATQLATKLASVQDVEDALKDRGITLTVKELGPLYRIVCRNDKDDRIVAATNGWVDPILKYMHCEALQVFTRGLKGDEGDRLRGGPRGLGLYVGVATFAYARSKGCKRAEILAINDDEYQHKRLVRYYRYFGFKTVKTVGDDLLGDVPDRLVWGGVGTRMDGDVLYMLTRWSPVVLPVNQ